MLAVDDRTDTRNDLLASARRLFARRGYDGTSIRAITSEAGANLGAVTYHFGSKRALYDQVLHQVLGPWIRRLERAIVSGGDPRERLEAVVRAFFEQLTEHPDQPFLILQEVAAGKPAPAPVREAMIRTVSQLADVIREGQDAGSIRPGDPFLMVLSVVSQPVYMSLVSRAMGGLVGPEWSDPTVRSAVVEHAVAFVRSGLSKAPEERSSQP
jgi:AcrR family transcriptional regulator